MSYRESYATATLHDEVNARWPNRSKVSDGWIGDAAHASRSSDHNPWVKVGGVGVVRARDFTAAGADVGWLMEHLRQLAIAGDPRLNGGGYLIWQGRIASERQGWRWRAYTGSNPHNHHGHVSVSRERAGFDSTAPWGVAAGAQPKDWFDMASEADLKRIVAEAVAPVKRDVEYVRRELEVSVPSVLDASGNETKAGSLRWRISVLMRRTGDIVTGRRPK